MKKIVVRFFLSTFALATVCATASAAGHGRVEWVNSNKGVYCGYVVNYSVVETRSDNECRAVHGTHYAWTTVVGGGHTRVECKEVTPNGFVIKTADSRHCY